MNTVTITGRFTADPEMKITSGQGKAVTTVRVAINEQGRDKTCLLYTSGINRQRGRNERVLHRRSSEPR